MAKAKRNVSRKIKVEQARKAAKMRQKTQKYKDEFLVTNEREESFFKRLMQ